MPEQELFPVTEAISSARPLHFAGSSPLMQLRGLPAEGHGGDFASISAACLRHACLSVELKEFREAATRKDLDRSYFAFKVKSARHLHDVVGLLHRDVQRSGALGSDKNSASCSAEDHWTFRPARNA